MKPDAGRLHVIAERDVGLFSLLQQVIANVPWAVAEGRVPVADFRSRTCYWTPNGHRGRSTVWEYYFEPLIPRYPTERIPGGLRERISAEPPSAFEVGYAAAGGSFVSCHFGDHADLSGATLPIPYEWDDPGERLRREAKKVLNRYVRPRPHIQRAVSSFWEKYLAGHHVIGVHVRGTDAVSSQEVRPHRQGSLLLDRYLVELQRRLEVTPAAKVFVASDQESSVALLRAEFPGRVIAYNSVRHSDGDPAGQGPTGWLMPAYITGDRDRAARNGEEAVIEYLLLSRCDDLVHNGSSLA
ncbi:MAG: hypothetical protein ACRDZ2_00690, partial [Ilumatobacteraceae bacterium]